jgi:hypothetical protein
MSLKQGRYRMSTGSNVIETRDNLLSSVISKLLVTY